MPAPVEDRAGEPAQDAAVEDDPPLPDLEDVAEVLHRLGVHRDVHGPGAEEAAREQPGRQPEDRLGIDPLATCPPGGQAERAEAGQQQHHAEAVEREPQARDREHHPQHRSGPPWPFGRRPSRIPRQGESVARNRAFCLAVFCRGSTRMNADRTREDTIHSIDPRSSALIRGEIFSLQRSDLVDRPLDQAPRDGLDARVLVVVGGQVEEGGDVVEPVVGGVEEPLQACRGPCPGSGRAGS